MKILITHILLIGILFAQDNIFRSTDVTGLSQKTIILKSSMCSVTFNGIVGVYTKLHKEGETSISCKQLSSLLSNFTMNRYSHNKIKYNNAGNISFGSRASGQCNIALELDDGKLFGTPYGDKSVCRKVTNR